jgi:anti-sigma factor RsiW
MRACACQPESLERYLDGALSDRARRRLEAHLQVCDGCRSALAGLRLTAELWRAELERVAERADFAGLEERVLAAAARQARPPFGERVRVALGEWQRAWRPVWVTAALTAGLVLVAVFTLIDRGPTASTILAPEAPGASDPAAGERTALADPQVDNEVIIDALEYRGQRSMVYSVSRNNTTVIWLVDFDTHGAKDQGDDL